MACAYGYDMTASNNALPETIPMHWHPAYQARGDYGCPICGKLLKPKDVRRYVHVGDGGVSILRADLPLGGLYGEAAVFADGTVDTGDMGWFAIGGTCAKKLGLAYSAELPPLAPLAGTVTEHTPNE